MEPKWKFEEKITFNFGVMHLKKKNTTNLIGKIGVKDNYCTRSNNILQVLPYFKMMLIIEFQCVSVLK